MFRRLHDSTIPPDHQLEVWRANCRNGGKYMLFQTPQQVTAGQRRAAQSGAGQRRAEQSGLHEGPHWGLLRRCKPHKPRMLYHTGGARLQLTS